MNVDFNKFLNCYSVVTESRFNVLSDNFNLFQWLMDWSPERLDIAIVDVRLLYVGHLSLGYPEGLYTS